MKFVGGIGERKLANCHYFTKTHDFTNPEDERIDQYIDHWQWRPLIECNTQYTEMLTRLFYANFELIEEPFICTTYICGKLIHLSLENLAIWLNLPNSGTEVHVHKKWPLVPRLTTEDGSTETNPSQVYMLPTILQFTAWLTCL